MAYTNFPTTVDSATNALLGDAFGLYAVLASCTGVPPTTANTFQHGCLMFRTDSGTGTNAVYQNTGSIAVPAWTILDTSLGGAATSLVDSNGVTALDTGATASAVNNLRVTNSATGAVTANAVLLSAVGTDAAVSLNIAPKGVTGKMAIGLATGTGDIVVGSSSGAQSVKIGDGAGVSTVNIANNGATGNVVNVSTGAFASTVTIGNTTGATAVAIKSGSGNVAVTGATNVTSTSATSLAVGANGATTPAFQVDSSTGSQIAGLKVTGAVTGGTVAMAAVDSGAATSLTLDGKGVGTVGIGNTSTGEVSLSRGARKSLIIGGTVTTLNAQSVTPTAAQLLGGQIKHTTQTAGGTFTLDTGTNISAAVTGVAVGDTFTCLYINNGNQTGTITTAASGTTLFGTAAVTTGKTALLTFSNTASNAWDVYITVSA